MLTRTVEHTTNLQSKLFSEATQAMVAKVGALPSLPTTLAAVDSALSEDECSLGQVADIMSGDVAMVAKILQLVNSSFFGLRTEIRDLRQAVAYLGIEALRDFALAGSVFRAFTPSPLLPDGWLASFNAHSLSVADVMTQLVRSGGAKCEANVAGALHDIGELVVAERGLDQSHRNCQRGGSRRPPGRGRIHHMGTTYPVIGGYLLSQWGMGYNIVEAVTCQREDWDWPGSRPPAGRRGPGGRSSCRSHEPALGASPLTVAARQVRPTKGRSRWCASRALLSRSTRAT